MAGGAAPPSFSGVSAEMTTAFAQVMSSLEELANHCRNQGVDPLTTFMTMMSSRGIMLTPQAAGIQPTLSVEAPSAPMPAALTPDDAEIMSRSRDLIEALDRGNVAAVEPALAPGFVRFVGGAATDREAMLAMIRKRESPWYIAQRTWNDERVVRKSDALLFVGRAHELQGGNDTHGGYIYDGWYLVQWVRAGDAWRAQMLTWQKESTARDWWNDTFCNGRGFSREPNRLLVETVKGKTPGAALDLAVGQGRNALYLASQGWMVTGVDLADEGLRIAREQAVKRNLALETINANIDEWDFGENRYDLVTMIYVGDHAQWIDKIKTSLRKGGTFVVEGWAKTSPDSPLGFGEGQLAKLFDDYEILRDETVDDVPDWAWDKGKLVRFVAHKK